MDPAKKGLSRPRKKAFPHPNKKAFLPTKINRTQTNRRCFRCVGGEVKNAKCVALRAGWLWILGDGIPGGRYHVLGRSSKKLRIVARSSIAREVLVMAQSPEAAQELSSAQGWVGGQKSAPLRPMVALACPLTRENIRRGTSSTTLSSCAWPPPGRDTEESDVCEGLEPSGGWVSRAISESDSVAIFAATQ